MMKNIRSLSLVALLLPMTVMAHPGDHHEFNVMTILGHFVSEPEHALMLAMVIALLWIAFALPRPFLVRIRSAFVRKKNKRAP